MKQLHQHETTTPTSQKYFESMFRDLTLQWEHIYTLSRITTRDSKLWCFQYKILHNTLCLNEKLFLFRKHNTSLCSSCNLEDETVVHLFVHCSKTKRLWCTVIEYFKINLHIHPLSPLKAIYGFLVADDKVFLILNHLLLLFKYYIYVSRSSKAQKPSWNPSWKFVSSKRWKVKAMKGKGNHLKKNGTQFCKICETLRKFAVSSLKIQLYYRYYSRSLNSVTHLTWHFCFNSKHLTTFCFHWSLPLIFDSLHLWTLVW